MEAVGYLMISREVRGGGSAGEYWGWGGGEGEEETSRP